MVDIKAAVAAAIEFGRTSLGPERTENIRLEEVESSDFGGRPVWLITLSAVPVDLNTGKGSSGFMGLALGADTTREYKVFTVDKSTGEVLAMKIRLLAVPTIS